MELIRTFRNLTKHDVAIAGGKGASLGEMTQAGIPVPPGYVILSGAFERFIDETHLDAEIDSILHKVNHEDINTVEQASEKIQALILNAAMPKDIAIETEKYFKKLNSKYVAVRSSATSEDSASAAWAGQLDSFLNTTDKTLLENVKRCWASLFTPRAIFYRFEKNLHGTEISVAVVVQKMVESEISGIAFSVHPVTQDYNQLIIEGGYGLGEAIVSGQITPDSYVVEKEPRRLIDKNIAEQEKGMYRVEGGGNEWKSVKNGDKQKLTDEEILELSELILKIEGHYGFPCDIEWAREKGKFYIVQSRPITTLTPQEPPSEEVKKKDSLGKRFLEELGNEKIMLFESDFIPLIILVDWFNYYDENGKRTNIYPALAYKSGPSMKGLISLEKYQRSSKMTFEGHLDGKIKISKVNKKYNEIKSEINKEYEKYFLKKERSEKLIFQDLTKIYNLLNELVAYTLFLDTLDKDLIVNILAEKKLKIEWRKIEDVANIAEFLSFDVRNNEEILKSLKKGLSINSLQHVYTNYTHIPSEEEVREKIKNIDIKRLSAEMQEHKLQLQERKSKKAKAKDKLSKEESKIADFLDWSNFLRDDRKTLINKCDALIVNLVQNLYSFWGIDKELAYNSFMFEILKGKEYVMSRLDKIKKREENYECLYYGDNRWEESYEDFHKDLELINKRLLDENKDKHQEGGIKGEIASRGIARGKARIVINKKDFSIFEEGEILVTGMTRPEFVPLMKKAAAIVTDEGGIASHAAIVSRELKKPCIIGTRIATQLIKDGDLVEVDADRGIVKILENAVEKPLQLEAEDYVLTFQTQGTFPLFEDVVDDFYMPKESLSIYSKGSIRAFMSKQTIKEMNEIGLKYSIKDTENKINTLNRIVTDIKTETAKYSKIKEFNVEDAKHIINTLSLLSENYAYFDFNFWDATYEKSKKDKNAQKNILLIENYKNKIRSELGPVYFDSGGYFGVLISRLSEKFGIEQEDIKQYRRDEVLDLFSGKRVAKKTIENRKKSFVSYKDKNSIFYFYENGHEEAIIKYFDKEVNSFSEKSISGKTANGQGKKKGRVKVINMDYSDLDSVNKLTDKMQEGDILVSQTTSPEMMGALKKASAIITDVGGLLSHAAITARELNIPCIVGTHYATKVLNDGDLIELDTEKGTIRILKKSDNDVDWIKKEKWTKNYEGKFSLFFNSLGLELEQIKKYLGVSLTKALVIYSEGVATGYFASNELDSFSKTLAQGAKKNTQFLRELSEGLKKSSDEMRAVLSKNPKDLLMEKNFKELRKVFGKFAAYSMGVKETVNALDFELIEKHGKMLEDSRKYSEDIYFKISDVCSKMLDSIAKKEGTSINEIEALIVPELEIYLNNKRLPSREDLKKRTIFSAIVLNPQQIILSGEKAREIDEKLHEFSDEIIKGASAFPGIVQGTVRIIKKFSKDETIEEGEVLVTGMTDPRFVPMMKKAKAIVTDAGGMLCHAAIVGRELKIPCVIGTRIATRALKNGDRVEVNANEGSVRILKKGEETPTFEKAFSRDIPFLLASAGFYNFPEALKGSKNTILDSPVLKQYINGTIEFWMNKEASRYWENFTKDRLLKDRKLLEKTMQDYENITGKIRKLVTKKNPKAQDVITLCHLFNDFRFSNYVMFMSSMGEGWPSQVTKWSKEEREKDDIWNKSDEFVRSVLLSEDLTLKQIKMLNFTQLSNYVKGNKKVIFEKDHFVEDCTGKIYLNSITELAKENIFNVPMAPENIESVEGQIGYKGKARGKVKLVFTKEDLPKVKSGDIIVSPMTTPDFISAMKLAGAFITDEGGQLCHAAIVARELKKPCVIGTKIATHVLKDGMEVEVDADRGLVKILGSLSSDKVNPKDYLFMEHVPGGYPLDVAYLNHMHMVGPRKRGFFDDNMRMVLVFEKSGYEIYVEEKKIFEIGKRILRDALESDQKIEAWERKMRKWLTDIASERRRIKSVDLKSLTKDELFKELEKCIEFWEKNGSEMVDVTFTNYGTNFIFKELEVVLKALKYDVNKTSQILLRSTGVFPLLEYEKEVGRLAFSLLKRKISVVDHALLKKDNALREDIDAILEKYGWLDAAIINPPKGIESVIADINNLLSFKDRLGSILEEREVDKKEKKEEKTRVLKEILSKSSKNQKRSVYFAITSAELGRILVDELMEYIFYSRNIYEEIAKRIGLGLVETKFLLKEEIKEVLLENKIIDKKIIEERKDATVCILGGEEIEMYSGEEARKIGNALKSIRTNDTSPLKGEIAFSKGKVKGIARLVKDHTEMGKVKQGEILVSSRTYPDLLPAMKRSAAIIAELGGLLSHAAIVSRELHIPCLVGVKSATVKIKDGDLIEVDTETGKIKILERK